jgi:ELWxxDGT repeat protein
MQKRIQWIISGVSIIAASLLMSGCSNNNTENTQEEILLPLCTEEYGPELWTTNGTETGTLMVKNINGGDRGVISVVFC